MSRFRVVVGIVIAISLVASSVVSFWITRHLAEMHRHRKLFTFMSSYIELCMVYLQQAARSFRRIGGLSPGAETMKCQLVLCPYTRGETNLPKRCVAW